MFIVAFALFSRLCCLHCLDFRALRAAQANNLMDVHVHTDKEVEVKVPGSRFAQLCML